MAALSYTTFLSTRADGIGIGVIELDGKTVTNGQTVPAQVSSASMLAVYSNLNLYPLTMVTGTASEQHSWHSRATTRPSPTAAATTVGNSVDDKSIGTAPSTAASIEVPDTTLDTSSQTATPSPTLGVAWPSDSQSSPSSLTTDSMVSHASISIGAIVGIVMGCFMFFAIGGALLVWYFIRRRVRGATACFVHDAEPVRGVTTSVGRKMASELDGRAFTPEFDSVVAIAELEGSEVRRDVQGGGGDRPVAETNDTNESEKVG